MFAYCVVTINDEHTKPTFTSISIKYINSICTKFVFKVLVWKWLLFFDYYWAKMVLNVIQKQSSKQSLCKVSSEAITCMFFKIGVLLKHFHRYFPMNIAKLKILQYSWENKEQRFMENLWYLAAFFNLVTNCSAFGICSPSLIKNTMQDGFY